MSSVKESEEKERRKKHSEYIEIHRWVRKALGDAKICDICKTETARKYEWSNKNHLYLKVESDWQRLCSKCHKVYDLRFRKDWGGECIVCKRSFSSNSLVGTYGQKKYCGSKCAMKYHNGKRQSILSKTSKYRRGKISERVIKEILDSNDKQTDLAKKYKVSQPLISRIKNKKIWKNVL